SLCICPSRGWHTRSKRDWSSDVCSSDLPWLRDGFLVHTEAIDSRKKKCLNPSILCLTNTQISPRKWAILPCTLTKRVPVKLVAVLLNSKRSLRHITVGSN